MWPLLRLFEWFRPTDEGAHRHYDQERKLDHAEIDLRALRAEVELIRRLQGAPEVDAEGGEDEPRRPV